MRALEVPEILQLVGEFLDYPRLAAAAAVCRSWNTVFTPFLYRTIEWYRHIRLQPHSLTLQDYVDSIRIIKISYMPWIPSLEGCTRLEELHLDNVHGVNHHDIDWRILTNVVHQNPELVTVCVTNPRDEFLRAVLTCCPQLKRLEIKGGGVMDIMITDLLLNVCLRLEELKLHDVTLGVGEHDDTPWINWPVFSTIKKLWIGITHRRQWYSGLVQQQHEFIRRCHNLESLTWSFERRPFPINEIKNLLNPKTSPCPKIKAFWFHYPGTHSSVPEDWWLEILEGGSMSLTSFSTRRVNFQELSGQVLINSLASTLTRLHLSDSRVSSVAMMNILSSCPHLVHVYSSGSLDAREILGIERDMTELDDYLAAINARDRDLSGDGSNRKSTGRPSEGKPLPMSIEPPEWACKNLRNLGIGICGLEGKAPEWQEAVLKQIAKLTQLRVLSVRTNYAFSHHRGSLDGLDFRLAAGLDILGSLTMFEMLRFHTLWQEMSEEDVEWMVNAWPRLSSIQGWVHHSKRRRIELKRLFKRHGIAVDDSE